jgi:hypothetical protein
MNILENTPHPPAENIRRFHLEEKIGKGGREKRGNCEGKREKTDGRKRGKLKEKGNIKVKREK